MAEEFISIVKEYYEETKKFVCYGCMLGRRPGYDEFIVWLEGNHPELIHAEEGK